MCSVEKELVKIQSKQWIKFTLTCEKIAKVILWN